MSRQRVTLPDGRFIVCGYDRPFSTFYAQLYDKDDDPNDPPVKAIGYHPMERSPYERTEHGDYPCSWDQLGKQLVAWGLLADERNLVGSAVAQDPDAPPNP